LYSQRHEERRKKRKRERRLLPCCGRDGGEKGNPERSASTEGKTNRREGTGSVRGGSCFGINYELGGGKKKGKGAPARPRSGPGKKKEKALRQTTTPLLGKILQQREREKKKKKNPGFRSVWQ